MIVNSKSSYARPTNWPFPSVMAFPSCSKPKHAIWLNQNPTNPKAPPKQHELHRRHYCQCRVYTVAWKASARPLRQAQGGPHRRAGGDRTSDVSGKGGSVRGDLGGRRRLKKKK